MENGEILGLDVGMKRTGIARAGSIARLAEPLATVPTDKLFEEIEKLITKNDTIAVVVGLPRNLQGDDTAQTVWVRDWVIKAKARISQPFYWQDEALTSKLAETRKIPKDEKTGTDALAAAIILQDFLDSPEAERVVC